jgi:cytochrome c oxidase subunit 2
LSDFFTRQGACLRRIPGAAAVQIHGAEEMGKRTRDCAGSTTVAATFAVLLVAFTAITVYLFIAKTWWFPPSITEVGNLIDSQFQRTLVITGIVFVLAQLGLAWVIWRYRDQGKAATYSEGNNTMEVVWTLATIVLFVGLGLYAESAWAIVHFTPAQAGDLQIEVVGQQFQWNFRYAGTDGKFGRYKTVEQALTQRKHGDQSATPWQLDMTDPDAKDDIITPIIAVPVNREVELLIRSMDVTHSFFVRELRLKQDAVPGMTIHMHFTATKTGDYELACAELCGLGHYRMKSTLRVLSDADFAQWLKDQAASQ